MREERQAGRLLVLRWEAATVLTSWLTTWVRHAYGRATCLRRSDAAVGRCLFGVDP